MSQTWVEDLQSADYESNGEADYEDPSALVPDVDARTRMLERRQMMLERQRRAAELRRPPLPLRPMLPQGAVQVQGPSPWQTQGNPLPGA